MHILVVEDDKLLNNTLCYNLIMIGYTVDTAISKTNAIKLLKTTKYNLIILDVNLPDGTGFELCKEMREYLKDAQIVFLTARDLEVDQLEGYEVGGDDYVIKPFSMSVFIKKIEILLARKPKQRKNEYFDDGNLVIDFSKMQASIGGVSISFTPLDYRILAILIANPHIILTRQVLLERLWDIDGNFVDEHALTSAMSRVRNKIKHENIQYIKTVYGMGYMWIGGVIK